MTGNAEHAVTTFYLFAMVILGGFGGGIIDLLHKIGYKRGKFNLYEEEYTKFTFTLLLLRSGFVGVGGSLALCAIRIYAGELKSHLEDVPQDILYNFALSVIAGFAARTLLPNIAGMLERRLEQQNIKIAEQGQAVAETQSELEKQKDELDKKGHELDVNERFFQGTVALNQHAVVSDIHRGKDALREQLNVDPKSRRAAILLARIFYEKEKDIDGAIKTLTDVLEANKDNLPEKDVADLLYNKACYLVLKAARSQKGGAAPAEIESLHKDALAALERSISLSHANATDAASDPDFVTIQATEQFQRLVRSV